VVIWRIIKKLNGKTYYYVGLENRGRRVWSANHHAAATWEEKEDAIKIWNDETNCSGSIAGEELSLDDMITMAWNTGNGWTI
jgi:hypothetical protein